jgi:hypothetical protein
MRKLFLLLLVALATVWMFKHPDDLRRHSKMVFAKLSDYFGSLAGKEKETEENAEEELVEYVPGERPSISKARPSAVPQELPDGVYCLTQPVRFDHEGGPVVQPAGTLVRKKGEGGSGKVLVTDEVGSAVIDASLLTRDPEVVARYARDLAAAEQSRQALSETATRQKLLEIDAKLASLKAELVAIQQRDAAALKQGRKVSFATSENFVRATILSLEKTKATLLASQKPPPMPGPGSPKNPGSPSNPGAP